MITVASVFVEANVPFTADYVRRLRSMVARHLPIPHNFICLTDRPELFEADIRIDAVEIKKPEGRFGWWSKIELFNPQLAVYGDLVLYLDLDVVVVSSLLPIITEAMANHGELMLIPSEGTFQGRPGYRVVKRYNSSVMTFAAGIFTELWSEWTPGVARRLWGDQDWIGERLPKQPMFPLEWFPRISNIGNHPERYAEARVVLCKRPKNEAAAKMWPWVEEAWR